MRISATGVRRMLLAVSLLAMAGAAQALTVPLIPVVAPVVPLGPPEPALPLAVGDAGVFGASEAPGAFVADYTFKLTSPSTVGAAAVSVEVPSTFSIGGLTLQLFDNSTGNTPVGPVGNNLVFPSLAAGTYILQVTGSALGLLGGTFAGAVNVSAPAPVPVPAAAWLLLSGLGGLGLMARRKPGVEARA